MPKTTRTFMPVAALTLCLLAGCSSTSTSGTPTVSGAPAPTTASAAPTSSGQAPSVSGSAGQSASGTALGTALPAAPAMPDHPAGFQLPTTGLSPVGTTSSGDLVVQSGQQVAGYDSSGSQVWSSGPIPNQTSILSVVGTKVYGLETSTTAASGLSTGGSTYSAVVFDTTKPKDPGVVKPTKQAVSDGQFAFTVGTVVYVFAGTQQDPYSASFKIDMATGAATSLTVPTDTFMIAGIDPQGAPITLQSTNAADLSGEQDILTNGTWSMQISNVQSPLTPGNVNAVTKMDSAADDLIGYTPLGDTPAPTQWIDGTGKTVLTTDNIGPLVWSPNKQWVAAGDEAQNLKTKRTFHFPATSGTAAAKFIAIDNDGNALTLGADGASIVQINTPTGTTKTLTSQADVTAVDRFGTWTQYTVNGASGLGYVMVPPAK